MSIRTLLTLSTTALLIVAAAAAVCLVVFTSRLDATATSMNAATDGIRIAEQLEVDLLRHRRLITERRSLAADVPHERAGLERALNEQFACARYARLWQLIAVARRKALITESDRRALRRARRSRTIRLRGAAEGRDPP